MKVNNTLIKIENGMSCFEILQVKISELETLSGKMRGEITRRSATIDGMRKALDNTKIPRKERFDISIELPIQECKLQSCYAEHSRIDAELKGLRKAIDTIIIITNYGGELTDKNRSYVESILNS